jgi:hypothetical protein
MGRELPLECVHGKVIDWADFGCECGPNGTCLKPSKHRAPEHCYEATETDTSKLPTPTLSGPATAA